MMDMKGRVFYTKQAMPGHRVVAGGGMLSECKLPHTIFEYLVFSGRGG